MNDLTTLQRPKHVTSLATSGMLFTVDISVWTGTTQDRTVSDEVATAKRASKDAGRYVRNLMAGVPSHKRLINHRQTVYNWLRRVGYEWAGKQVYVPLLRVPSAKLEYDALKAQFEELRAVFRKEYQTAVSNAAFTQGDMFRREDYPSLAQLDRKFSMELYTSEVPSNDFRVQVAHDLADDLHNSYVRQTEEMIDRIMSKQAQQLISVMESLSHCCDSDTVIDKDGLAKVKRRKIYDGTVQKALELANTFKSFNLTENPHIEKAAVSLGKLLSDVPIEALRESDSTRAQIKSEVDDILSKFRPVAPQFEEDDEEEIL